MVGTISPPSPRPSPRPRPRVPLLEPDGPPVDPLEEVLDALDQAPAVEEPAPEAAPSATKRRRDDRPASRWSAGLVGFGAFVLVFGALFGLAAFHSVLVQNQLKLDRLHRDVDRETARNRDLRLQFAENAAPARILAQAAARGMVPSRYKQPLQAVLPGDGKLVTPSAHPFASAGAPPPTVPPTTTAPPVTTAPTAASPASSAPAPAVSDAAPATTAGGAAATGKGQ